MSRKPKQDAGTRDRTYFRAEHRAIGPALVLTSFWFHRRGANGRLAVGYKLLHEGIFRSPRELTAWLDDKDEAFIAKELKNWKERVNQDTRRPSEFFPDFFLKHRPDFIKWCAKTAKSTTVEPYLHGLGNYVFPFFVQRLREKSAAKWHPSYPAWDEFLSDAIPTPAGRNRVRTSLRRYLKFLKAKGLIENIVAPVNENERKLHREGEVIPGEIPNWSDVLAWLNSLPAGRARWIVTMCAVFGVRVSEAVASKPTDLIGDAHLKEIMATNDVIKRCVDTRKAFAFLNVFEAKKRRTLSPMIVRLIGDVDDEPKTGPYIACCSSIELAEFIVRLIRAKEFDGEATYEQVYSFIKGSGVIDTRFPFPEYAPHDFRRLHITLQAFEFLSFFLVAQVHGHASEETTKKYYQWGMTRRQKQAGLEFKPIRHSPE